MRNNLTEDVKKFYEQYLYLRDVYNTYLDSDRAEKFSNCGKPFFQIACSACYDSYIMALARLFDKNSKSKTLNELINICKNNKDIFENPDDTFDFLTEHLRKLKQDKMLKNAVEVIGRRRNKYFAHNDKEYFTQSDKAVIDPSYLPLYEITMLIYWIKELLEKLMKELDIVPSDMLPKYNHELAEMIPEIKENQMYTID